MRSPLLPREQISKIKLAFVHVVSGTYNISVLATYWISADRFLEHMGWLDDAISQEESGWKFIPIVIFAGFELVLLITNQRNIPKRIEPNMTVCPGCYPCSNPSYIKKEAFISSLWKSVVSTTSLWALLNDFFNLIFKLTLADKKANILSLALGGTLSLLCLPGNLIAQMANFLEYYFKKWKKLPGWFITYIGIVYGAGNAALYFNTFNKVMEPWLDGNLTELNSAGKILLFSLNILFSLKFMINTSSIYCKRILSMTSQNDESSENQTPFYKRVSFSGMVDASWKTLVTSLSVIKIINDYHKLTTGEIMGLSTWLSLSLGPQGTFYAGREIPPRPMRLLCCPSFFPFRSRPSSDDPEADVDDLEPAAQP